MADTKNPPPIKRKRLDHKILTLLNYKNQHSKKGLYWPAFIDEQTGEIGEDAFFNFPVNTYQYFEWFSQSEGPTGYTYYRVCRWYRYRPLLFSVDIMSANVNRGLKKAISIKSGEVPEDVQNAFQVPKLEFDYIQADQRDMNFRTIEANVLDFYEFQKYETPKSQPITEKRFRAMFQAIMEAWLHPQSFDISNPEALDKIFP